MKTRFLVVLVAVVTITPACKAAKVLRAGVPGVEFPAVENLTGIRVKIDPASSDTQEMVVRNGLRMSVACDILAYGEVIAILEPGEELKDLRVSQPRDATVPLIARCRNPKGEFIGMAAARFQLSEHSQTVNIWTIIEEQVVLWHGKRLSEYPRTYPQAPTSLKRVKVPKKWAPGTGVQVAVNYGGYYVECQTGKRPVTIRNGDVLYIQDVLLHGQTTLRAIPCSLFRESDRRMMYAFAPLTWSIDPYRNSGYQFVFTPHGVNQGW